MSVLSLKIRPLPGRPVLPLPAYQTSGAAGLDLSAAESVELLPKAFGTVGTGLAFEIPLGFEGQVRPRSGLAAKHGVTILNAPGTIDSDYRGELRVILINHSDKPYKIEVGDRIAQLVIAPVSRAEIELVTSLEASPRGSDGFGSTGR